MAAVSKLARQVHPEKTIQKDSVSASTVNRLFCRMNESVKFGLFQWVSFDVYIIHFFALLDRDPNRSLRVESRYKQ